MTVYKTVMPEIEAKTRLAAARNDLGAYPEFELSEQQGDVDISVTNGKFGDQFDEDFLYFPAQCACLSTSENFDLDQDRLCACIALATLILK